MEEYYKDIAGRKKKKRKATYLRNRCSSEWSVEINLFWVSDINLVLKNLRQKMMQVFNQNLAESE